jgi:hypothetical protein
MVFMCTVSADTTTNFAAMVRFSERYTDMNRFDGYDTIELGKRLVQFQAALEKCTSEQPNARAYIIDMIRAIARELLYRYRQETELLYSK